MNMKKLLSGLLVFGLLIGSAFAAVDLGQAKDEYIKGNTVYLSDLQLLAGDFPNATTLYGWNMDSSTDTAAESAYAGTKFGTSKDLTLKAQKLTAANDVLGNSKYNAIIAGGYLQSTDTVFNVENTADTDDFMVGGWVYIPDATPASTVALFSNWTDNDNGWQVLLETDSTIGGTLNGATDPNSFAGISTLGWYHILFAREVGVGQKLYLNGNLAKTGSDATVGTTQSKFQLGGRGGADLLPEAGTRYDECFFKKGVLPTNLDDVVKGIYARSAKKFAVKDANTNVFIPELNVASGVYTPTYVAAGSSNVIGCVPAVSTWSRIGPVVTVCVYTTIDPDNAAPTDTRAILTLPISCAATPTGSGVFSSYGTVAQQGYVTMNSATTFNIDFYACVNTNRWGAAVFQYVLN